MNGFAWIAFGRAERIWQDAEAVAYSPTLGFEKDSTFVDEDARNVYLACSIPCREA